MEFLEGFIWDLNPGPPTPKARITPLHEQATAYGLLFFLGVIHVLLSPLPQFGWSPRSSLPGGKGGLWLEDLPYSPERNEIDTLGPRGRGVASPPIHLPLGPPSGPGPVAGTAWGLPLRPKLETT